MKFEEECLSNYLLDNEAKKNTAERQFEEIRARYENKFILKAGMIFE